MQAWGSQLPSCNTAGQFIYKKEKVVACAWMLRTAPHAARVARKAVLRNTAQCPCLQARLIST